MENHDKRAIKKYEEIIKKNTGFFSYLLFFFLPSEIPKSKGKPRVFATPAHKPLSLYRGEKDVGEDRE